MAFSITGTDANGRITTGTATSVSAGILIPPESAGVGDIVYCKQNADPKELDTNGKPKNIKIIGCGTVSNTNNITIGTDTYVVYGVIYGFVNGMARVVAISSANRCWTMAASASGDGSATQDASTRGGYPVRDSTIGNGNNIMRNGNRSTYTCLNVNGMMQSSYAGDASSDLLHPNTAADTTKIWSKSVFEDTTNYPDANYAYLKDGRRLYGTWKNYLRQMLATRNPGSCFAAHDTDHKAYEQGKWNTYLLGQYTKANPDLNTDEGTPCWYPAANYCYNYFVSGTGESADNHNWWLPSMDEIYDLITEEHQSKVNASGVMTLNNRMSAWSSIRSSVTNSWRSAVISTGSIGGICDIVDVRYALQALPVTLLQLV